MSNTTMGIYAIQNTVNAKRYVGSAVNLRKRWNNHRSYLRKNKHENQHLQSAWNKYGEAAFLFEVIEYVADASLLIVAEQDWIDTCSPEYNICRVAGSHLGMKHSPETLAKLSAASLGRKHTPETRAKMSAGLLGNTRNLGKKRSPATRAKISAANLGKKRSPETLVKISAAKKGKSTWNKGKNLTPEHRAKLSAAKLGGKQSPEHRKNHSIATKKAWARRKENAAKGVTQ